MDFESTTVDQKQSNAEEHALSTADLNLLRQAAQFLGRFRVLVKLAQTHERHNQAVREAAEALYSALCDLLDEVKVARFDVVNDFIYFNGTRIGVGTSEFDLMQYLVEQMTLRNIGSMILDDAVEPEDLLCFAFVFTQLDLGHKDPFDELLRLMALEGIAGIAVSKTVPRDMNLYEQLDHPPKEQAKRSFISALRLIREAVKDGIAQGKVNPRKIKRVIETIVDTIISDERSMLALTAIRNYDEYTYYHSFNVCIYSIALANRLGLPRKILAEIGAAALFHDIGKTDIPQSILNKMGNLTEEEWKSLQQHTIAGVKHLTQLKRLDSATLQSIIVAFCHHLNMDSSGYPQTMGTIKPDAISRIVRIVDIYEALTSARSYRMKPFSKAEALEVIAKRAGTELDATLCAVFAETIGPEHESSSQSDSAPKGSQGP